MKKQLLKDFPSTDARGHYFYYDDSAGPQLMQSDGIPPGLDKFNNSQLYSLVQEDELNKQILKYGISFPVNSLVKFNSLQIENNGVRHDIKNVVSAITTAKDSENNLLYGPRSVVTYYGDTSDEDRQKAIKLIQDPSSKVRFLVGTTQTAGYGLTLTEANTMIYFSNGYDLEKRTQSEARINRIGQKRKMTYVDIICENTVDEKIVKALRKKINIASEIMGEEIKNWI